MLPPSFLDWWFSPWSYALDQGQYRALSPDLLAQRDGYRLWCRQAQVAAELPRRFDPTWHSAVLTDGTALVGAARLFSGLIAAREHHDTLLRQLSIAERKWCASIAATQPLRGSDETICDGPNALEIRGLAELALRLRSGFPGMWSRLRLTLSADIARQVERLLENVTPSSDEAGSSQTRAQRCWALCRTRAGNAADDEQAREDD